MGIGVLPPTDKEALAGSVVQGNHTQVALGLKLREYRQRYNVSRRLLAETAGVSKTTILRIENGIQSPSMYTFTHLLVAARQIVKTLYPTNLVWVDRWLRDMLILAAMDTEASRDRKKEVSRVGELHV